MADTMTLSNDDTSVRKWMNPINPDDRFETRANYRKLICHLHIEKPELVEPPNEQLLNRLNACNAFFKEVRTPREGVLDAVTLKTISKFARLQTIAINKRPTTAHAFDLIRKCGKIIRNNVTQGDDVFAEFYLNFCHCHKASGTMNFMGGRLPTFWFEKRSLEKSFMTPRSQRTKEVIDSSQHTQIKEIKKMVSRGEQTSKDIIRIHRCLEKEYENNHNQPISFFMFTIHPTLFSRSVENIFHVSFLIKEGKAELFLDTNELPVLRPLKKLDMPMDTDPPSSSSKTKSEQFQSLTQLILSLDMEQWESLVQVFHIQTAMINNEDE